MFIQPQHTTSIVDIISNKKRDREVREILDTLSTNSDKDMERAFKASLQENPHDPTHRLIYADWLEEKGRPTEAHLHRLISQDPHMIKSDLAYLVSNPSRRRHGEGFRRATPLETSLTAGSMTRAWSRARGLGGKAREQAAETIRQARLYNSQQATEHHYQAAVHHLEAIKEGLSSSDAHRLAAHAHIIAAGVHRGEYPTENA